MRPVLYAVVSEYMANTWIGTRAHSTVLYRACIEVQSENQAVRVKRNR